MILSLDLIGQEETNWCWAAVTQAILKARGIAKAQEEIVSEHIERMGGAILCTGPNRQDINGELCLPDRCTASCNDPHRVMSGLAHQGCTVTVIRAGVPRAESIRDETGHNHSIPCDVQWTSGDAHVILICGWQEEDGDEWVYLLDPKDAPPGQPIAPHRVRYGQLRDSYSRNGKIGNIRFSYRVR